MRDQSKFTLYIQYPDEGWTELANVETEERALAIGRAISRQAGYPIAVLTPGTPETARWL